LSQQVWAEAQDLYARFFAAFACSLNQGLRKITRYEEGEEGALAAGYA